MRLKSRNTQYPLLVLYYGCMYARTCVHPLHNAYVRTTPLFILAGRFTRVCVISGVCVHVWSALRIMCMCYLIYSYTIILGYALSRSPHRIMPAYLIPPLILSGRYIMRMCYASVVYARVRMHINHIQCNTLNCTLWRAVVNAT